MVIRDLDLIQAINERSGVRILFSINSVDLALKQAFEPRSPGTQRRLDAMRVLADAGIVVGTAIMPIIPFAGDSAEQLEAVTQATVDHGGQFVLGGGLSMGGNQTELTLQAAGKHEDGLDQRIRAFYQLDAPKPASGPSRAYRAQLGNRIRELAARHGIPDRMPRYIANDQWALTKRLAERLFLKTYDLELELAEDWRVWNYRKAAWAIDELHTPVETRWPKKGRPGCWRWRALARPSQGTSPAGWSAKPRNERVMRRITRIDSFTIVHLCLRIN